MLQKCLSFALIVATASAFSPSLLKPKGVTLRKRPYTRTCAATESVDVCVVGGGPAGLAAALTLTQLNKTVTVIEKRSAPDEFQKSKAYLYLVDKRGQRLTDRLNLTPSLRLAGVSSDNYTIDRVFPDARGVKTITPPLASPQGVWIPRAQFLSLLSTKLQQTRNVSLLYGSRVESVTFNEQCEVRVSTADGSVRTIAPTVLVGADGIDSIVRDALKEQGLDVEPRLLPSASSGLEYKILALPSDFKARDLSAQETKEIETTPSVAYTLPSKKRRRGERIRLGLLPVREGVALRTANVIQPKGHRIWQFENVPALRAFLDASFPQLATHLNDAELQEFLDATPGRFPAPQFVPTVAAHFNLKLKNVSCFLVGDAAHAFPPDLGQGVNSALEDVDALGRLFREEDATATQNATSSDNVVVAKYQGCRAPAAEALAKIVRIGFPYQYDQSPFRAKFFFAGFLARLLLSRLVPFGLVAEPAALGVLKGKPYVEVWRDARRTTRFFLALGSIAAALGVLSFVPLSGAPKFKSLLLLLWDYCTQAR